MPASADQGRRLSSGTGEVKAGRAARSGRIGLADAARMP
jgi:hypothetical protein